jgi:hypothetical protein
MDFDATRHYTSPKTKMPTPLQFLGKPEEKKTSQAVKFRITMIITETYPDLTFNNYEEFEEWCRTEGGVICSREKFNELAGQTINLPKRRVVDTHVEWIHHEQVAEYLVKKKIVIKGEKETD